MRYTIHTPEGTRDRLFSECRERRQVQTGRSADGRCTQILGGLTQDDWVAFPYLSTIREGASTREATMDDFYNS